jgi:hypothetical protein
VDGPHLHVHQQACGARLHAYVHDVQALRHAEAGVQAQQLHAAPFHFFMSGANKFRVGTVHVEEKLLLLLQLHAVERGRCWRIGD